MKPQNLVEELKKSGIRAAEYKRPPVGKDVFALTILPRHPEGVVTVNQGTAKVEVHGNRNLRQAAVTVEEKSRHVSRAMEQTMYSTVRPGPKFALGQFRRSFPVIMPAGTRWSISKLTCKRNNPDNLQSNSWQVTGVIRASVVNNTVNHFLIGMDETRHFISPLPRKANSVLEARKLLRPRVRPGVLRQGEWFFVPCTRKQTARLNRIANRRSSRIGELQLGHTTHTAKSCIRLLVKKQFVIFARGYITDNRVGHHKSLFLTKWHRVVKNKEAEIKVSPDQRVRAIRMRQTWD